jgi:hypothetical protein
VQGTASLTATKIELDVFGSDRVDALEEATNNSSTDINRVDRQSVESLVCPNYGLFLDEASILTNASLK